MSCPAMPLTITAETQRRRGEPFLNLRALGSLCAPPDVEANFFVFSASLRLRGESRTLLSPSVRVIMKTKRMYAPARRNSKDAAAGRGGRGETT